MLAARARRVGRVEERLEIQRAVASRARERARRLEREALLTPDVVEAHVTVRADAHERRTCVAAIRTRRSSGLRVRRRRGAIRPALDRRHGRDRWSPRRSRAADLHPEAAHAHDARAGERQRKLRATRRAQRAARGRHDERRRRRLRTSGATPPKSNAATMLAPKSARSHQPLARPFEFRHNTVCPIRAAMESAP